VLDVRDDGEESCTLWIGISRPERFMLHQLASAAGPHAAAYRATLLSAIFQERFGLPTVSFHLGAETSTIDLRGAEPSEAALGRRGARSNDVVFGARPVTVRYGTQRTGAAWRAQRSGSHGHSAAIEIEGVDLQPCGGTHVKRTSQIG